MKALHDTTLRHDVEKELEFNPALDARKIGVATTDGVVTLTGTVGSYSEKWTAEKTVKQVMGVKGVANDLEVVIDEMEHRDDGVVARSAVSALDWNFAIPKDKIQVSVAKGWLTLDGEVEWHFQKRAAADAVRDLRGVRGVTNDIVVRPKVVAGDVKEAIGVS